MSDDRWQRIEELFHHAADLAPSQRDTFLNSACAGDYDLRRQVESLLANDDSSSKDNLIEAAVSQAEANFRKSRQARATNWWGNAWVPIL
jgi:hypothetical protein